MSLVIVVAGARAPDVRRLPRLQRHPVRADLRTARGAATDPALVAPVFSGVFMDKMVRLHQVLPAGVPARRGVRQGDRAVGLRALDRHGGDRPGRPRTQHAVDRAGLRAPDLRRRVALRRGVRGLPVRRGDVPAGRHSEAAHPRNHRARRVHLHDGRAARHAADPEHHPDRVLQDRHAGRRPGSA